jgi:hypothetical protein
MQEAFCLLTSLGQIYRTADSPNYYTGNKVLLGLVAYNICVFVGAKIFYVRVNA